MSSGRKDSGLGTLKEEARPVKRRSYVNKGRRTEFSAKGNSEWGGVMLMKICAHPTQ